MARGLVLITDYLGHTSGLVELLLPTKNFKNVISFWRLQTSSYELF